MSAQRRVVIVPAGGLWTLEITGGYPEGPQLVMLQANNLTADGIGAMLATYFDNALALERYSIQVYPSGNAVRAQ